jgi:HEAT repeat protein
MTSLDHAIQELTSGKENRAEASARSFPSYGEDGLRALATLSADSDADTRWWAVRTAAEFDLEVFPGAASLLITALGDSDSGVQACAAVALRQNPIPNAIPALIDLLSHRDQLVCRTAADALVALKGDAVAPLVALLEAQDAQHTTGRVEAVRALALIADPGAIPALFRIWEHGSQMQQHWAERGLSAMGIGMQFFNPGE